jgi:hypothetical protein
LLNVLLQRANKFGLKNIYITRMIKSGIMTWAGHVARMEKDRNAYRILAETPEGKRPLGRQKNRWEDNIAADVREVG